MQQVDDMIGEAPPATLSVVLATHRRPAGLRRLLTALAPQVRGSTGREIVVINDGSHDAGYDAVLGEFSDVIRYEALAENVGIGAVRNRGAALARHDFIVYTDDDCEPPDWWLDWLAAQLRRNPDLDVLAGTTRPLWSRKRSFMERVHAHYRFLPEPRRSGDMVMLVTANVAIRRRLLAELGGFAALRAAEDTELSVRLARAGARVLMDDDWFVLHEVGGGLLGSLRRYRGYGYANVAITRLNTAPSAHDAFARARRRFIWGHLRWWWADMRRRSADFSPNAALRVCSAAAATAIQVSHYLGCADAARRIRRLKATLR
jgi:glycosyltransferase involved in cell wall biosynthesis